MEKTARYRPNAHAVIIGINKYQDHRIRDLRFARNDANAIRRVLNDPRYGRINPENTTLLLDEEASAAQIRKTIAVDIKRAVTPKDFVYIFFAGHGAPEIDSFENSEHPDLVKKYLLPSDADSDNIFGSCIPMSEVNIYFNRIQAKQVMIFLDTCYSGLAGGRTFHSQQTISRATYRNDLFDPESIEGELAAGKLVVTACGVNEISVELDELKQGLFSYYLVKGLKGEADYDKNGKVTIDELYDFIYKNVEQHARQEGKIMRPVKKGEVQGQIIISWCNRQSIISPSSPKKTKKKSKSKQSTNHRERVFRSEPADKLADNAVQHLIWRYEFFCADLNESSGWENTGGKGFSNKFRSDKGSNRDSVVKDLNSGLYWQKSGSETPVAFYKIGEYLRSLNFSKSGGYDNWRLPTLEEAMSLMEPKVSGNNLHIKTAFESTQRRIWTADRLNRESIWIVSFYFGACFCNTVSDNNFVRAVRDAFE